MQNPLHRHKGIVLVVVLLTATGCSRHGLRILNDGGSGSDAFGGPAENGDAGTAGNDDADSAVRADAGAGNDGGAGKEVGGQPGVAMLKLLVGGLGGPGDVDGIGMAARFYRPAGVYLDGQGNLFVADGFNHIIRRIVLATGAVTTVAGSPGASGSSDGFGEWARFYRPSGITGDGAGHLFVSDEESHTIRMIALDTRAVSTLAGSPGAYGSSNGIGSSAQFNGPRGLATDGNGNLFVADSSNYMIRKIAIATNAVSTFAGKSDSQGSQDGTGTSARFVNPTGITNDGHGNLFVVDSGQSAIRKVVIASAAVSTIAPPADVGFYDVEDVTNDGAGNLYLADALAHLVRKVVVDTGAVTILAGSTSGAVDGTGKGAEFNMPSGLVYDPSGNLFVADSGNNTIRKVVVATGVVTTFAGLSRSLDNIKGTDESEQFFDPQGIASDDAGNLLVADRLSCAIRRVVLASGEVSTFAGSPHHCGTADGMGADAGFMPPYGMINDGAGSLFIVDLGRVRRAALATSAVTTLAGSKDNGYADGLGASARFNDPAGLAGDGAGNLFIADIGNHAIRKVVIATGEVSTFAGSPQVPGSTDGTRTSALFNSPEGIASDGAGNLFVADSDNHTIRKIVIATGEVTTMAGLAGQSGSVDGAGPVARFNHPRGLATDGKGNLFVADTDNHTIRKVAVATQNATTVVGVPGRSGVVPGTLPASLSCPSSLLVGPTGQLYITDDCGGDLLVAEF